MRSGKYYAGIDYFRLAAALLVVAIHTSPLASVSETGDFILSRVMCRVAVPFFFMTSGFFVISRYDHEGKGLKAFVKKAALIYAAATLMYAPVNAYAGYFGMDNLLPNMIKDIVFDGTFYHLWYLPASVMGAWIAWKLVRKLDYRGAFMAASGLYLAGLFGDSYYGIAERVPCLNFFCGLFFQVSDQTRNGIFFAPIFLVLGGYIAGNHRRLAFQKTVCGFGISFFLMLIEAMALHAFDLQRHDSMYVFLPVCVYFLFQMLLYIEGRCPVCMRTVSLLVYLIHPMVIIAVRGTARALHTQALLIENSVVHYFVVCAASVTLSAIAAALWRKYRPKRAEHAAETGRTYIEINREHLEHNVGVLQDAMPPGCALMAVVKANAYGHGAYEISTCIEQLGVTAFAVATIDEGIRLRSYGIRGEILILGYTDPLRARELKRYDLMQTLIDFSYAKTLDGQGISVKCHIKIDTGMHRLGLADDDPAKVKEIFGMRHLMVCGIYTHLGCADSLSSDDMIYTEGQIDRFYRVIDALEESGFRIPALQMQAQIRLHLQSSYGLWNYPKLNCDYVRVGIALYGVHSTSADSTGRELDLRPVLVVKTRVVLIRPVKKGDSVGYGRAFTADRESRIAILPAGYADGIPRNLSDGKGGVMIRGQYAPIVGRVCMDQMAVDVTDVENISVGDTVTLIGTEEVSELTAPDIADLAGSISNELLCRLGARLPIVVK